MIKVLFMIHDLGCGGAEKVLVNLVNNMDHSEFDITVISLFGGGVNEQFLSERIHYRAIFSKAFRGNSKIMKLFTPKQLHKFFVKEKYDIEISYLEGSSARIISGCPGMDTKLISWIHVEQHTKGNAARAFRSYKESVKCYQKFQKTVCVSEAVKQDFMKLYPQMQDIFVLYNTNETDEILRLKEEPVEMDVFRENEMRLCGVGKIMPSKGFDKLARIHKRFREEGYPVHTYLLGTGPEREKIEAYLRKNGLEDSFTFLGYQTNPYKYVAKCDVFVCTSSAEGFSTAASEALIAGTAVVTTPVAGMEEMLGKNGEYGLISEMSEESLYEKLKDLLNYPEKMKHYTKQAEKRGKFFLKQKTVAAVEEFLRDLAKTKVI